MIEKLQNIYLWEFNLSDISDNFNPAQIIKLLDCKEQKRYDNFKNELACRRFLMGRYMIKTILANYLKINPQEIIISISDNGKPFLANKRQFGALDFNITHCKDIIIVAVYDAGEIGVDTEFLDRKVNFDQISSHYFHPEEYKELKKLDLKYRKIHFLKLWTLKEAIVKLIDESIIINSQKLQIRLCAKTDEAQIIKGINKNINLKMMSHPENYITSIAWQNKNTEDITINWHQFNLENEDTPP